MRENSTTDDAVVVTIDGVARVVDFDAGRRTFLRSIGLATGAGALVASGLGTGIGEAEAQALDDTTILNFALNLEYLEAEFYLRAAFGTGLEAGDTTGVGQRGHVSGGQRVPFASRDIMLYAREIANDEKRHVKFLRKALGSAAVARPEIDIGGAFLAAARAAGLVGPGESFSAYANDTNFLLAAFIFEDVGVTAYKGAAPLISSKAILSAAAGILAVEAYHAGIIRTVCYARGLFSQTQAISDLRDSVDGPAQRDQGIGNASGANLVPTDADGLAISRTVGQVLPIVYLGGSDKGGFFPKGINL